MRYLRTQKLTTLPELIFWSIIMKIKDQRLVLFWIIGNDGKVCQSSWLFMVKWFGLRMGGVREFEKSLFKHFRGDNTTKILSIEISV